jgi:hypothetical protein
MDDNCKPLNEADYPVQPTERCDFLKKAVGVSAAAAIMNLVPLGVRSAAWAGGSDGLEKTDLTVGIIPLTDCAPIVVAYEKGFFKKHGLNAVVSKEASWANIRDKVSAGALDALTRASLQDSVMEIQAELGNIVLMITHDVDEAVLLSDRTVMMTNGPSATIGQVLDIDLPRLRNRLRLAEDPHYNHLRSEVLALSLRQAPRGSLTSGISRAA